MDNNNQTTLAEYLKEVEEQNVFLLNEMSKYPKESKIYKLRQLQYQTNLICIKKNLELGMVLIGPTILD
jgi:site-specific DNA-adenine methylase